MHAKSLQLCLTLCDPMGCSPPGSSVHGILQARILEYVSMPSSRGSSQSWDLSQSWNRYKNKVLISPALIGRFFTTSASWEALWDVNYPSKYLFSIEQGKKSGLENYTQMATVYWWISLKHQTKVLFQALPAVCWVPWAGYLRTLGCTSVRKKWIITDLQLRSHSISKKLLYLEQ